MEKVTIKTNNHWHEFKHWYDLTNKQQANFDYLSEDDRETMEYIVYKQWEYTLNDFMNLGRNSFEDTPFKDWHGYHPHSFFSGVLIRISDCGSAYQIATYYS